MIIGVDYMMKIMDTDIPLELFELFYNTSEFVLDTDSITVENFDVIRQLADCFFMQKLWGLAEELMSAMENHEDVDISREFKKIVPSALIRGENAYVCYEGTWVLSKVFLTGPKEIEARLPDNRLVYAPRPCVSFSWSDDETLCFKHKSSVFRVGDSVTIVKNTDRVDGKVVGGMESGVLVEIPGGGDGGDFVVVKRFFSELFCTGPKCGEKRKTRPDGSDASSAKKKNVFFISQLLPVGSNHQSLVVYVSVK